MKTITHCGVKYEIVDELLYNQWNRVYAMMTLDKLRSYMRKYSMTCLSKSGSIDRAPTRTCVVSIHLHRKVIRPCIKRTTRVKCETNACELIVALALLFPVDRSLDALLSHDLSTHGERFICDLEKVEEYRKDLETKKDEMKAYFQSFIGHMDSFAFSPTDIAKVYLCGKKVEYEEINALHKDLPVESKKDAKPDVYVQLKSGEFIGISVKQTHNCTKSNYSVAKYFDREEATGLKRCCLDFLKEKGFPVFKKEQRRKVNALFYERDNPYFNCLGGLIRKHGSTLRKELCESIYATKLSYPVYEVTDRAVMLLEKEHDMDKVTLEEWHDYYRMKSGKRRNAAKMFYKLMVGEVGYRVEIRWKGTVYTAHPQFFVHPMEE